MQLPDDYLPGWAQFIVPLVLGAGGAQWFRVVLENRRLGKKEFRETMLERIRELESVVARLQTRVGNERVETAHLKVENKQLRRLLNLRKESDADTSGSSGSDDIKPA